MVFYKAGGVFDYLTHRRGRKVKFTFVGDKTGNKACQLHLRLRCSGHVSIKISLYLKYFLKLWVIDIEQVVEVRRANHNNLHVYGDGFGAKRGNRHITQLLSKVFN